MSNQNKKLKVLVLGGNGFIGSQIVNKLAKHVAVTVGTRRQKIKQNEATVQMQKMLDPNKWVPILQKYDVVVNSVGILRERKNERYDQVHHLAVAALAKACTKLDVNLVHISVIGLSGQAGSQFIQSKFFGEQAIVASGAKATIIRPSLLDGEGGYGAKWFRRVAAWPIQFVMKSEGLVAPLQVSDLGEAIANIVMMPANQKPALVELGGNDVYDIPNYLSALRRAKKLPPALQIHLPKWPVRIASHIFDMFAWTPLSYGHYELMQGYNVPSKKLLSTLLGRKPSAVGVSEGGLVTQVEAGKQGLAN